MNKEMQIILDHFFGQSRLEDIPEESIDRLIGKYPYLNVARFLHVKKSGAEKRVEKHPGLFFNNPLWFEFLLQEQEALTETPMQVELVMDRKDALDTMQEDVQEEIIDTPVTGPQIDGPVQAGESSTSGSPVNVFEEPPLVENEDQPLVENRESDHPIMDKEDQQLVENRESDHHIINHADQPLIENGDQRVIDKGDLPVENTDIPAVENAEPPFVEKEETSKAVSEPGAQKPPIPVLDKQETFTFEPYHTIDYFASQGIRLQQADLSRDKFGKQLKSFTEWLKSMKRLPDPNQSPIDQEAQDNVVRIAEHSIENKDVYTEAMAEVWAKQGNYRKAIDIYRKLSLINPAKSPYFAAKIEQLNNL